MGTDCVQSIFEQIHKLNNTDRVALQNRLNEEVQAKTCSQSNDNGSGRIAANEIFRRRRA
jgi:hypothetical protein